MPIKSPFNFVPVSDKVFFPKWASQISQDIPFRGSLSGTINLRITAETPIFIRNGHTKEDAAEKNDNYNSFSFVTASSGEKRYFIPATSIKGEVRSVLETISFGKLHVDHSARFARRDLNNRQDYNLIGNQAEIRCGWLKSKDGKYVVEDCGRPLRIEHKEIDRFLGEDVFQRVFGGRGKLNDSQKTAQYKYSLLRSIASEEDLRGVSFRVDKDRSDGSQNVCCSRNGDIIGSIVLTGQPSKWGTRGKHYEFVFRDKQSLGMYEFSGDEFKEIKFIYDQDPEHKQWKWLKHKIDNGGAPVFFRLKEGNTGIKDLGFTYLYKMPYSRSVRACLSDEHNDASRPDLAECIFGYSRGKDSLKGRVQFGNAFADCATVRELGERTLVLASPKASYYPEYIKQDGHGGTLAAYATYDKGKLSGRKRYYLRNDVWAKSAAVNEKGEDTQNTIIRPLDKGAEFNSIISFHNLRPEELGALLSALTFAGGKTNRHQLGMAKPYGYGKCRYDVKLDIEASPIDKEQPHCEIEYYIALFEGMMEKWSGASRWQEQQEIRELLTITSAVCPNGNRFQYMQLDMNGTNEFNEAKKARQYLEPSSSLLGPLHFERDERIDGFKNEFSKIDADRIEAEHARIRIHYEDEIRRLDSVQACDEFANVLASNRELLGKELYADLILQLDLRRVKVLTLPEGGVNFQTIEEFFPIASSFGQWKGKTEKWKRVHKKLDEHDLNYLSDKLIEAYRLTNKQKQWANGQYQRACAALVGEESANEWFQRLSDE